MALVKSTKLTEEQEKKLQQLIQDIPDILAKTEDPSYDEIYGYRIAPEEKEYVNVEIRNEILLKFLIAREYDIEKAKEMLVNTFNWRRKFLVLSAAYDEKFDKDLEKMGVITNYEGNKDNFSVVTWNLYANLKNPKKLFAKFGVGSRTYGEIIGTFGLH
ncbi:Non-classical phosphatidylinositol transfer protein (PITP) [Candidozyma auris]